MIKVELTDDEALLFRAFREKQDLYAELLVAGVFNIRGGSATVHFNSEGIIDSIDADIDIFRKGKKQLQYVSLTKLQHEHERHQ